MAIVKMFLAGMRSFQIMPSKSYKSFAPKSASELMNHNWNQIGNRLHRAIKEVDNNYVVKK
ncbi:MAG: hypothetical protein WCP79_06755 [Bacillota bacterium]